MKTLALKLIDNTLFIDNSRLEVFTVCPRKAEYAVVHQRVPAGVNAAFLCGGAVHLALNYRYKYYGTGPVDKAGRWRMEHIIDLCYKDVELDIKEYRTAGYVKQVLRAYMMTYPTEQDFDIVVNAETGKPMVEESFSVYLGDIDGIRVVWKGRIDLVIRLKEAVQRIFVMDTKTSSVGGEGYFSEYHTSSQMQGYDYALQKTLGLPIAGVTVNAIFTRKITKTGKGIECQRGRIPYDQEIIDAWQMNTLHIASDFLHNNHRGYFPMHTKQCMTRYGACAYLGVCQMAPSNRHGWLYSSAYKLDEFDPLKPELVDVAAVHNMPLPADWESQLEAPLDTAPREPEVNLTELLHSLAK